MVDFTLAGCLAEYMSLVQSKAYRTILTHFSQRYPKIPKIESSFLATTCIAFDLMSINLKGELNSHVVWVKCFFFRFGHCDLWDCWC